ncbi:LigB-domain-containing protein [Xylona heveae TC161]|uniref:LigB-domain-containing protein n=1 Tax=Xylona heveae (strain CBS 132557 / TC161) TaxID=1328760 RepID=A0A165FD19_XYLHT|nr:LigB-domain-containing protein [Xylona heveae TC161]KZF20840.1 LigB-domain-containing protein [Xylona heveae TC161]
MRVRTFGAQLTIISVLAVAVAVLSWLAARALNISVSSAKVQSQLGRVLGGVAERVGRSGALSSLSSRVVTGEAIARNSRITLNGSDMGGTRTPVYFLSHGGPNVIYQTDHPAYGKLGEIGKEITSKVQPKAVVVFSAHWQGEPDTVLVNTAEMTDLIYDFYGFPAHYYDEKFPNVGSKSLAENILNRLRDAGIRARGVTRGLDHGVWASFKCAFNPQKNPLNVPIVQVSLFGSEDPASHVALGRAVSALREEGVVVIVSGMAVHNLRDLRLTWGDPTPLPYTSSFDEAVREAVEGRKASEKSLKHASGQEVTEGSTEMMTDEMVTAREDRMKRLLRRTDARQAHPTFDHLLPLYVGAGAAGHDQGKRVWTLTEGSMSWGMYKFGEVA